MRKLFTWVLALALIVTMAAPALAITGDLGSDDDLTSIAPVLLDVGLFTTPPTNTAFGGFSVSQIAANKVYIVNEVAYYGVALKFYDPDEDEEIVMDKYDYRGANLELTSDALSLYDGAIKAYVFDKDGRKVGGFTDPSDWKMEDCEWRIPGEKTWKTGNTVYFFGQGVVKAKGVLKAELTKSQKVGADADHALVINDSDGDEVCRVWKVNSGFVVNVPGSGSVLFKVDGDNEVTGIFVKLPEAVITKHAEDYSKLGTAWDPTAWQEVEYRKIIGGGSIVQVIGDYKGDDLEDAEDLYNDVMDFFGFDYDAEGVLLARHFERKAAGLYLKDEVAVDLYTGSIVQPDPNVQPPKTGDAASVMGFAMIVLALAAMGFVVSRKVHA